MTDKCFKCYKNIIDLATYVGVVKIGTELLENGMLIIVVNFLYKRSVKQISRHWLF